MVYFKLIGRFKTWNISRHGIINMLILSVNACQPQCHGHLPIFCLRQFLDMFEVIKAFRASLNIVKIRIIRTK